MKAIIVPFQPEPPKPTQAPPPLMYAVIDGMGKSTYPPLYVQPPATSSSFPTPARDPIVDYYAMYCHEESSAPDNTHNNAWGLPNSLVLYRQDVSVRIWELRKLTDWINAACEDYVLIQRSSDGSFMWLVFMSLSDMASFSTWYREQNIARHEVSFKKKERENEFDEWMTNNILGRKRVWSSIRDDQRRTVVSIENEKEELHFKLRWIGVPEEEDEEEA